MSSRTERSASTEVVEAAGVRFDPYLSYQTGPFRDSPPIPNHWDNLPNLVLFDERNERGYEELPVFSVTQDRGVVRQDSLEYSVAEAAKDRSSYKRVRNGDLVYNKMRMWQGAVGRATADGIVSPAYVVLKPKETVDSRFFGYFYRSSVGLVQSNRLSYGIVDDQNSLRCSDFLSGRSPVPPRQEQVLIADFLDRQTSRINDLIAKKERLIELLAEKRTALITQAVTKGLDPDVPMKDSGVEWLGEIPEHWDLARLSRAVDGCFNGIWGDKPDGEHDVACLRVEDFDRFQATVRTEEPTTRSVEPRYRSQRQLEVGDLLLEKSGGGKKQPVGFVVLVNQLDRTSVCSNFAARMPVRNGVSPSFLRYVFYHLYHTGVNIRSIKQTTGIQNLDASHYLSTPFALPSISVQHEIARYLEDQTDSIRRLILRIQEAIDRLHEYRSALITAVVTGKIDVRDHAA